MRPFVVLVLAVVGCGSSPQQPFVSPPPSDAAPSAQARSERPPEPPAAGSTAPSEPAAPPTIDSAEAKVPTLPGDPSGLALEAPYLVGHFAWPDGAKERKAALKDQETWNLGGVGEGQTWHPAPRVVIGEPVVVKGKADTRDVMRELRAEHYWTVRRCYDPALREHPKLDGRAVVEIVVDKGGRVTSALAKKSKVPDTRVHKTGMSDKDVVRCWTRGLAGAALPRPRSKGATLAFSIDVWPGDAPLPETGATPKSGKLDIDDVKKRLEARLAELGACVVEGRKEKAGAWGRLVLRVDVGEDGAASEIVETESTFPVASVVACATRILRAVDWPKARGGTARIAIPLRFSPPR